MHEPTPRAPIRLPLLLVAAFALTTGLGLWLASAFALIEPHSARVPDLGVVTGVAVTWLALGAFFHARMRPLTAWLVTHREARQAPDALSHRLRQLSGEYWILLALYALASPLAFTTVGGLEVSRAAGGVIGLFGLHLAAAVLVGVPVHLHVLDWFGVRFAHLSLAPAQVGLRTKLVLAGALTPLLAYALLMDYHARTTGGLSAEALAVWGILVALTLAPTVLALTSTRRALRPLQELRARNGASPHAELADLRPASTDEIGSLIQTLRQLFQRLVEQSSHMRAVVDHAAEGIIVVNDAGRVETFNPTAQRLFGYRLAEIHGQPLAWLLPEAAEPGAPRNGTAREHEMEGLHRDGYFMPVAVRVSEMTVGGKRLFTYLVADISERKAAETKVRAAEARYRYLVETAHDLVWSADSEGNWTYLNRATRSIYGYEPEEMIGRAMADFRTPEYARQDESAFAQLLAGKDLVQYETVHLDRHGNRRSLSFNAKAHREPGTATVRITGTARDVTAQKAVENQLTYQADYDSLTGLHNRRYFQRELERVVAHVTRRGIQCAVLYLDLDQFKYINDTAGHASGDSLLVEAGALFAQQTRDGDLVARFGGDEFMVLLYNVTAEGAMSEARKFHELIEHYTYAAGATDYKISASIGVAIIDEGTESADDALAHADLACNLAKSQGRNRIHVYNPADRNKAGMAADMGWVARVREMIRQDRFMLVFQPIFSVEDGSILEYEVLMRMVSEDGELILPGGFMPAAERFGLIQALDRWMVTKAIQQLAHIHRSGHGQIRFSINLSGRSFEDPALLPLVQKLLLRTRVNPATLTFEITETAAIANLSAATQFIRSLKRLGCQFALDDFGSGFCSFTYLKHLPVDKLKIDGSFVQGLALTPMDQAMVRSMNQVAHALGKVTVAEFVENAETLDLLRDYGVDFAQGYYLGHPEAQIAAAN